MLRKKLQHSASNLPCRNKILLRIDARTQVLVDPKDATAEYAEKLRQRYKLNYHRKAVGGRKKR